MLNFIDDLAGAIFDIFTFILRPISYLLAGSIIIAVPMFFIVWVLQLLL